MALNADSDLRDYVVYHGEYDVTVVERVYIDANVSFVYFKDGDNKVSAAFQASQVTRILTRDVADANGLGATDEKAA